MSSSRQQQKKVAEPSPNDILSRMLKLEKANQQNRQSKQLSRNPPREPLQSLQLPGPSSASNKTFSRLNIPSPLVLVRSHTSPDLSLAKKRVNVDQGMMSVDRRETSVDSSRSPRSTICHSPSWSDHGADHRKEERKRMDRDKVKKTDTAAAILQEEEPRKRMNNRATKRLSKRPPPAAMETQRLPTALQRQPVSSPPTEEPAMPSRSEKRSSISSVISYIRSRSSSRGRRQSTSSSSTLLTQPLSSSVPQLGQVGGVETGSYRSLTASRSSITDDEAYVRDIADFTYQLQNQVTDVNGTKSSLNSPQMINTPNLDTPPPSRSRDGPIPKPREAVEYQPQSLPSDHTPTGSPMVDYFSRQDNGSRDHRCLKHASKEGTNWFQASDKPATTNGNSRVYRDSRGSTATPSARGSASSLGASSYVYKQRMHQQQLSIAGYVEELAVSDIRTSMNTTRSSNLDSLAWPPTPPETSSESLNGKEDGRHVAGPRAGHQSRDLQDFAVEKLYGKRESQQIQAPTSGDRSRGSQGRVLDSDPRRFKERHDKSRNQKTQALGQSLSVEQSPVRVGRTADRSPTLSATLIKMRDVPNNDRWALPLRSKERKMVSSPVKGKEEPLTVVRNQGASKPVGTTSTIEETLYIVDHPPNPQAKAPSSPLQSVKACLPTLTRSSTTPLLPSIAVMSPNFSFLKGQAESIPKPVVALLPTTSSRKPAHQSQEIVIKGIDGDSMVRKTSVHHSRSDPELQVSAGNTPEPSVAFLPKLKHQALEKPKRVSGARVSFATTTNKAETPTSPEKIRAANTLFPASATALTVAMPKLPVPSANPHKARRSTSSNRTGMIGAPRSGLDGKTGMSGDTLGAKPIAKMFVVCCKCKFWHDMPSKLYEAMAMPQVITSKDVAPQGGPGGRGYAGKGVEGKVFTTVKCPWCEHGMSTGCCAGWTTVVYLHERHH